jgi:hypothetical protein
MTYRATMPNCAMPFWLRSIAKGPKAAGRLVARYLILGHSVESLIATLSRAVLREDAEFHTYQMLEAGVQQYRQWADSTAGRHILIAVARYIAAHSPTERAQLQTAMVARRLSLGEAIHEAQDEEESSPLPT